MFWLRLPQPHSVNRHLKLVSEAWFEKLWHTVLSRTLLRTVVVILALLLWLRCLWANPQPPLLRAPRPIPLGVGVIRDSYFGALRRREFPRHGERGKLQRREKVGCNKPTPRHQWIAARAST